MKVLHFSYATTWGGGEQQMVNLIEGTSCLGVNNLFVGLENSMLHKYFEKRNIDTIFIKREKGFNFSYLKSLYLIINENNPDIIHIHTGSFLKDFLVISFLYELRSKVVFTMNGMIRKKSLLSKMKYNNKHIDKYYCISKSVESNFRNNVLFTRNYPKTVVVYDGIDINRDKDYSIFDLRSRLGVDNNVKIVGNIGNHTQAKDLMTFLKVVNYTVNQLGITNFFFVQIGRFSKLTPDLMKYIEENNLNKNVSFIGYLENARTYLQYFDCFLMTSYREGLSMSILEAFLYETPVVSTNAGGVPEAVVHNETGLLAQVGNYRELSYLIKRIINDEELKQDLITKAKVKLHKEFTIEILAANTLEVYNEVLS